MDVEAALRTLLSQTPAPEVIDQEALGIGTTAPCSAHVCCLIDASIYVQARTRVVSRRLLERGALMTSACSSTVKFFQVNSGSTYD